MMQMEEKAMITEYVLTCPNAIVNKEKGLSLTTKFFYKTYTEAAEHKKLCDEWDISSGKKPKSYITKIEKEEINQ